MNHFNDGVGYLFSGQGDQAVGMGRALYEACPQCRALFHAADEAVDLPLLARMFAGPPELLNQTQMAQPATVLVSVAEARHLAHSGRAPDVLVGHSLGHLSALVVAGVLELPDAIRLAVVRGRAMQAAVPLGAGAMAAVLGLGADDVEAACRRAGRFGPVGIACYNAPGRLVITGAAGAVQRAIDACEAAGGAAVPLAISTPCHSSLMAPAVPPFAAAVAELRLAAPATPVLDSATATYIETAEAAADSLVAHFTAPVRFEASLRRLLSDGIATFVQCGPGSAQVAFARRTDRSVRALTAMAWCPPELEVLAA